MIHWYPTIPSARGLYWFLDEQTKKSVCEVGYEHDGTPFVHVVGSEVEYDQGLCSSMHWKFGPALEYPGGGGSHVLPDPNAR